MIARFLKESVILQRGNRKGLFDIMRKLNGKVISGLGGVKDIGYWFYKEFSDKAASDEPGSLICFSYISCDSDRKAMLFIHLFGTYAYGGKANTDKCIGLPFSMDNETARKNINAFLKRFMSGLMKISDRMEIHNAVMDAYYKLQQHDWSSRKG